MSKKYKITILNKTPIANEFQLEKKYKLLTI